MNAPTNEAVALAIRELIEAARWTVNAAPDEVGDAVARLRLAGQTAENLLDDLFSSRGLLPLFRHDNVTILDPVWRRRHQQNAAALDAAADDEPGWTQ